MNNELRGKEIQKVSIIGIITNIFLVLFKIFAGIVSGSIAIVLDALNNLTDALSSIVTIIGIKLAKRHPDNKHPYGYGRIEYFSALLVSAIILMTGVSSFIESLKKIKEPVMANYEMVTVVIIVVSIFTKFFLGKFLSKSGKRLNSDALIASGADSSFDSIISATTLLCAVVTILFKLSIEGFVGLIISLLIIKAGIEMLLESISNVMGKRFDSEITVAIKKDIASLDEVIGAYDLVLHNYGPDFALGSVHIEVPSMMNAYEINQLSIKIYNMIMEKYHIRLTIGIYAIDMSENRQKEYEKIREIVKSFEGAINAHAIFIDEEAKYMSFDTVIDFRVNDKNKFIENVKNALLELYPGYTIAINLDANYSD